MRLDLHRGVPLLPPERPKIRKILQSDGLLSKPAPYYHTDPGGRMVGAIALLGFRHGRET